MPERRKSARLSKQQPEDHHEPLSQPGLEETKADHSEDGEATLENDDKQIDLNQGGVEQFQFPFNKKTIVCERRGPASKPSLIWTHGAGGGLEAPATKDFADGFAERASIVSFKGAMNLVSRTKTFHAVIDHEGFDAALGGRSMGSRAACIAATQEDRQTTALVLVTFPLIGAKNDDSREQILLDLPETIDVLFISGTKDSMCELEQLAAVTVRMQARSWLVTVDAANHGMDWKWKDSAQEMRRMTGAVAAEWLGSRDADKRHCVIQWDGEAGKIQRGDWKASEKQVDEAGAVEIPVGRKRKKTK